VAAAGVMEAFASILTFKEMDILRIAFEGLTHMAKATECYSGPQPYIELFDQFEILKKAEKATQRVTKMKQYFTPLKSAIARAKALYKK
jgi:hypothetical protein